MELEEGVPAAKPRRRSLHNIRSLKMTYYVNMEELEDLESSSHEMCEPQEPCWQCRKLLNMLVEEAGEPKT